MLKEVMGQNVSYELIGPKIIAGEVMGQHEVGLCLKK
jgi:hypothetical protein